MKKGKVKSEKKEFSFRAPIKNTFNELRALGYFAKENHTCCNSCGWSEVPDGQCDKVVFYHNQDLDHLKESQECYLSWAGNGKEIVDILERNGLKVKWNGKGNARIHIQIVPKNVETREIINCKTI